MLLFVHGAPPQHHDAASGFAFQLGGRIMNAWVNRDERDGEIAIGTDPLFHF